jgi:hypothetical protein
MTDSPEAKRLNPVTKERPRGILSPTDREYLAGESDLEPQSERRRRQLIRERGFNAILDFWLLYDYLEDRDLEQVFDQSQEFFDDDMNLPAPHEFIFEQYRFDQEALQGNQPVPDASHRITTLAFEYSLIDMIAFAVKAADHLQGLDVAEVVESGMSKYLIQFDRTASVETTPASGAVLQQKLGRGMLNPSEFDYLLEHMIQRER